MKQKKYASYILLCLITIIVLGYILYYNLNKEKPNILKEYISEIKYDEIKNHIVENSNVVIYATYKSNNNSFEGNLKKAVVNYNLGDRVLYFENSNYKEKTDAYKQNNILIFYKDNKISKIVSIKNLSYKELIKLFKTQEIIDD